MERRKRAVFCSLAVMVLTTAFSNVINRAPTGAEPKPVRLSTPAPSPWTA